MSPLDVFPVHNTTPKLTLIFGTMGTLLARRYCISHMGITLFSKAVSWPEVVTVPL